MTPQDLQQQLQHLTTMKTGELIDRYRYALNELALVFTCAIAVESLSIEPHNQLGRCKPHNRLGRYTVMCRT